MESPENLSVIFQPQILRATLFPNLPGPMFWGLHRRWPQYLLLDKENQMNSEIRNPGHPRKDTCHAKLPQEVQRRGEAADAPQSQERRLIKGFPWVHSIRRDIQNHLAQSLTPEIRSYVQKRSSHPEVSFQFFSVLE